MKQPSIIDRTRGMLAGLLHSAQTVVAPKARYEAAGQGRRMRGWNPPTSGPNTAMVGLQKIRDRSQDTVRNDWSGASAVQKWCTNLIGMGITPRFSRLKGARKTHVRDLWADFTAEADADGVLDFYGMQTLATRAWLSDGEAFIRVRPRDPKSYPGRVPMQVQLIEAAQVPLLDATTWPGLPEGNVIRSGLEFNRYGRKVAVWMYREHPGDAGVVAGVHLDPTKLLRIPMTEVRHLFEPSRIGQLRGVPMLTSVLARLRSIENFDDAVMTRQMLANLFTLFITKQIPEGTELEYDSLTGLPTMWDKDGMPAVGLTPGLSQELAPGEDVKFANPPEAGTTYSDYMRTMHTGTAAGTGLPYEIFSGDIKEVSDRTLRVVMNEFRRFAGQRQWQILIPMLCRPVMGWFAMAIWVKGEISEDEIDPVSRAEWSPEGWAHIHPVQDPQGKKMEVEAGFRSRSSVIGERAEDPEDVDNEREQDMLREKARDLWKAPAGTAAQKPGADQGDTDGIDNNEYSAPPNVSGGK